MKRVVSLLFVLCLMTPLYGCEKKEPNSGLGNGWIPIDTMQLEYAEQFSVDYYEEGYKLISLSDSDRFLVIPEGKEVPEGISDDIQPLYQPVHDIYLVATSAMCLFDALDRLDAIRLSGTTEKGWYISNAAEAMRKGTILYAGKYSEPDYELILEQECPLAIESTMIGHASEVKEKLESLGIAVLVDRSSYESHPLGRTEWIRLYGALLNEEEKAEALFRRQAEFLDKISQNETDEQEKKTVAFFYISSSGTVITRKSGDYISKMIELAGGTYLFDQQGDADSKNSSMAVEMETFFSQVQDADYIVYNSSIDGSVHTLNELLSLNGLLSECKAVKNGNVWCTSKNMFQETMNLGQMIENFHEMLMSDSTGVTELDYLYRLQ